jgi:hypothetical protein
LFNVVALEAMRANEVEELEHEATLWEEGDRPRVRTSGGMTQMQCELFLDCCYSCLHLVWIYHWMV